MIDLFKFYIKSNANNKLKIMVLIALNIFSGFFKTLSIYMLIPIINGDKNNTLLLTNSNLTFFLLLTSSLLFILLHYFKQLWENRLVNGTIYKIKIELIEHLNESSWLFLKKRKNNIILSNLHNNIEIIQYGLKQFIYAIASTISLIYFILLAIILSYKITFIVIVSILPFIVIYFFFKKKYIRSSRAKIDIIEKENENYQNLLGDFKSLLLFPKNKLQELKDNFRKSFLNDEQINKLEVNQTMIFEILTLLIIASIYYLFQVFSIEFNAKILVLVYVFSKIFPLVKSIFSSQIELVKIVPFLASFQKLKNDLIQHKINKENAIQINALKEGIKLSNISFHYVPNIAVLDKFNAVIKAKHITKICGKSGRGKTTLLEIIVGLLKSSNGEIKPDNQLLKDYFYYTSLSYISQENYFPNISLKSYLNSKEEKIKNLINYSSSFNFLKNIDLQEELGEGGINFSGGERQRIAFLKVLLDQKDLIILDEATSFVDDETAKEMYRILKEKCKESTIIIVNHTASADEIIDEIIEV